MKLLLEIKEKFTAIGKDIFDGGVVMAVNQSVAMSRLKDKPKSILLVAYPEIDRIGKQDNDTYLNDINIWAIQKWQTTTTTHDEEDKIYNELQKKLKELIDKMKEQIDNGCSFFRQVMLDTIEITPVYNFFGGFNGWYCNFKMK